MHRDNSPLKSLSCKTQHHHQYEGILQLPCHHGDLDHRGSRRSETPAHFLVRVTVCWCQFVCTWALHPACRVIASGGPSGSSDDPRPRACNLGAVGTQTHHCVPGTGSVIAAVGLQLHPCHVTAGSQGPRAPPRNQTADTGSGIQIQAVAGSTAEPGSGEVSGGKVTFIDSRFLIR